MPLFLNIIRLNILVIDIDPVSRNMKDISPAPLDSRRELTIWLPHGGESAGRSGGVDHPGALVSLQVWTTKSSVERLIKGKPPYSGRHPSK